MANKTTQTKKVVEQEMIDLALAKAIADGDIVNFRFLFLPYSPLREDSTEDIHSIKYSYLLPSEEEEQTPEFKKAMELVSRADVREHVQQELRKKGPAQLSSDLLLALADNAVRQEKFTSASQAYELLRIRRRMQELFFEEGDKELETGDISKAVKAYYIASSLEYDYSAFPEPLPAVPRYQDQALILHAEYKTKWNECIGNLPLNDFLSAGFNYLFLLPEHAGKITSKPIDIQITFFVELVRKIDPHWEIFIQRVRDVIPLMEELYHELKQRLEHIADGHLWEDEWDEGIDTEKFLQISKILLGRELNNKEWWAYLKELVYEHPPAGLFISRQMIGKEQEIILPRYTRDNPVVPLLNLPELPIINVLQVGEVG